MMEVVVEGPETELVEKIKRARGKDEEVMKFVEEKDICQKIRSCSWK